MITCMLFYIFHFVSVLLCIPLIMGFFVCFIFSSSYSLIVYHCIIFNVSLCVSEIFNVYNCIFESDCDHSSMYFCVLVFIFYLISTYFNVCWIHWVFMLLCICVCVFVSLFMCFSVLCMRVYRCFCMINL